jgi:hypothetical protein
MYVKELKSIFGKDWKRMWLMNVLAIVKLRNWENNSD